MPTVFSHAAVPLVLRVGLGARVVPPRLLLAGVIVSALPDLDVVSFKLGIPYSAPLGHRGVSHSLSFAALVVLLVAGGGSRPLGARFGPAFAFLFVAMASHGVLDACTKGGLGVAFLWPFSDERFFAPVRVIEVSRLGVSWLLSARGAAVLRSELRWIWLPAAALGLALAGTRAVLSRARRSGEEGA